MVDLTRKGKPKKIRCEVCFDNRKGVLEYHHVKPRSKGGDDNYWNLSVICSSCHSRNHHGDLNIIGIYPSTDPIMGRTVIYEDNGVNKYGIQEPYYTPKPKAVRWYGAEKTEGSK